MMGVKCFADSFPGLIAERNGGIKGFEVVMEMAANRLHFQQLLLEPLTVFAHAQMDPDQYAFKQGQLAIH